MHKSRRGKDNFRYQRVDLVHADSSDDSEDDLDRVLGPSNSTGPRTISRSAVIKKRGRCANCCIVFTLSLTVMVFGFVVVFGTVLYPGSIKAALERNQIFDYVMGRNETNEELFNSTTLAFNETTEFEISSSTTESIDTDSQSSTTGDANDDILEEEKRKEIDPDFKDKDDFKNEMEQDTDSIFRQEGFDFNPDDPDFRSRFDDFIRPQRNMNYEDDEEERLYPEYQESVDGYPFYVPSNDPSDAWSLDKLEDREVASSPEPQEETTIQYFNTTEGEVFNSNTTTFSQDPEDFAVWPQEIWVKYKDNHLALLAAFAIFLLLAFLFTVICCFCKRKARERAKKKHFERLVSDLNATEKFTLVTPSDEEDVSD